MSDDLHGEGGGMSDDLHDVLDALLSEGRISPNDAKEILEAAHAEIPSISRIRVDPGDAIVFKYDGHISPETANRIRDDFRGRFGDIPILVLGRGIELSVLSRAEIESRIEGERIPPERIIELP